MAFIGVAMGGTWPQPQSGRVIGIVEIWKEKLGVGYKIILAKHCGENLSELWTRPTVSVSCAHHRTHLRSPQAYTNTHTSLTTLCPGLPRWAGTRQVKPIWILPKQETVSGSGISWAICKHAHRSRQITTPAPNHSVFYRPTLRLCICQYGTRKVHGLASKYL